MKGQLKVATPEEYIAALPEPRRGEVAALDALIRKTVKLEPFIHSGMLAYGPCQYKCAGGPEREWFRIGVASNARAISLYLCGGTGASIPDHYRQALPKADIGRGCVRFKRLGDLDPAALKKLIREGAKA